MTRHVIDRRNFLKGATTGGACLTYIAGGNSLLAVSNGNVAAPKIDPFPGAAPERKPFDPLLDPACRRLPIPGGHPWQARWIWYPGQLASHLQAKGLQAAMRRCMSVGYPGTFRQPLSHVYLRVRAKLEKPQTLQWAGPLGRLRPIINGKEEDITSHTASLDAGSVEFFMAIDFAEGLPCLLLDGGPLSSGPQWEASLDRKQWVPVESEPILSDPRLRPDADREWTVEIPVDRMVKSLKVKSSGSAYQFEPGGDLFLDFRHDELGKLAFNASGTGKISLIVGESLEEVESLDRKYFEQEALPEINLTPGARQNSILLPERCARYVRIQNSDRCQLSEVCFQARVSPVEYQGRFECSDALLNDIWAAGAATLHACLHSFYLDGIRRDALSWHDGLMALEAGDLVFFDAAASRQTIVSQSLPSDPTVNDLGIVDAPLYALAAYENDYLARGDLEFSRRYSSRIHDTLRFFQSLQDERGFVSGRDAKPYGFFPDWSSNEDTGPDSHGTPAYAQMLLMRAFEIGAAFARRWKEGAPESNYRAVAEKMRKNIREIFWDEASGIYLNGFNQDGALDRRFTSYAQVNAILFDLVSPQEWDSLFARVLDNLAVRPAHWSIGQQWEFLAYAKAGRIDSLLNRLRSIWGDILKRGYTRFWEDIRPSDNPLRQFALYGFPFGNSLCHGWAGAAPLLALMRGVLGIWPKQGGYAECEIRPRLDSLKWVKGSVPTPTGKITLELVQQKGGTLTLPAGVFAQLSGYLDQEGKNSLLGPGTFTLRPLES